LSSLETLKADTDIKKQLLETEVILLRVKQSRIGPGGSMFTPVSIYVTNMRVIYRKPIWVGLKSEIIVVNYQDIADIRLKRGVVHTDISLKTRFHTDQLLVRGANNNLAERANALVQQGIRQEHVGQGKRDDFDSTTALGSVNTINQQEKVGSTLEQIDRLAKLADLKQKGALTEEEFHKLGTI
jgi:Bacterial PH domain